MKKSCAKFLVFAFNSFNIIFNVLTWFLTKKFIIPLILAYRESTRTAL